MLKSEYDAFTTKYNELLVLKSKKDDLVSMKNNLDNQTITSLEIAWSNGRDAITYALSNIKSDLASSINDEISTLTSQISTKKGELIALNATTTGTDSDLSDIT